LVKKSFISLLPQEEKDENQDSVEFQVLSFTNKIRRLTSHLELHKRDFLSQRGLQIFLRKHQHLFYLSKKNRARYKKLIDQLKIWASKNR
uniref:Small ribosomal subunit protein uS15c n=1 Tax=Musa acuminata subsp. malaccensis TaxID=214687 RepID=A0A804JQA3_MUSAM